jgi:hypothetical protein
VGGSKNWPGLAVTLVEVVEVVVVGLVLGMIS